MSVQTLLRKGNPIAHPLVQLRVLNQPAKHPPFARKLAEHGLSPLRAENIHVLQLNLGKLCNQTCRHCHVDAGPDRREIMSQETVGLCLDALAKTDTPVVDITGGAPEMNPHFRWLITEVRKLGRHVIDRCNLTILLAPGYQTLGEFLAEHNVEVIASLPCYLPQNTDAQRGQGVFAKSILALRRLNALGYGQADTGRILNLVYNPNGAFLPPSQAKLEAAYRRELLQSHGIGFNRLYTITNMPISRFLDDLLQSGQYDRYMDLLVQAFNPVAVPGLMCHSTLSVDWRGFLYDCDFNQMLGMELAPGLPQHIRDFDLARLQRRRIATGQHCYGCTAGCGSGCQGAVVA